jgi:ribosome biogenesis GTPase
LPDLDLAAHPDPTLDQLGFTDRVRALFEPFAEAGMTLARVLRADRGSALVATATGIIRAEPSTKMRKAAVSIAEMPAAGDWVALHVPPGHDIALVEAVLPRVSAFVRGDPGKSADGQVLAANIDTVFVVHSMADEPNLRRIERELSLAWESGATPVVVLAKADLSSDTGAERAAVEAIANGVDVHVTSAETGEGVEALLAYAEGNRTVAFIGPSGVGKSTLINHLIGEERQATAEVRLSDGKGRHTTVSRELVPLRNGGVLVDTPGLRAVAMVDADDGVATTFSDIRSIAEGCRFRDCTHENEPGCAVLAAVESGGLESGRLESWRKLRSESRSAAIRADARLSAEARRKAKAIAKAAKDYFKTHGA